MWEASGCGRLVGLRGSRRLVGVKNREVSGCRRFFEIMKKKILGKILKFFGRLSFWGEAIFFWGG